MTACHRQAGYCAQSHSFLKQKVGRSGLKASFDKAAPRTKKQLTKADINTPSTTNPRRQPNAKTDSETTFSGTTSIQQGRQQQHRTQIPQPN